MLLITFYSPKYYHEKRKKGERARNLMFAVYSKSALGNWRELIISELWTPWIGRPLHDKDMNPDVNIKNTLGSDDNVSRE